MTVKPLDITAPTITPPMVRYRAPSAKPSVFLGGSIEMGSAFDWQTEARERLYGFSSLLFNPRRADWDSTWEQTIDHPEFNAQVHWELDRIAQADFVLLHFEANTKSPITLQEHGICSVLKPERTFVSCPEDFWRRGNVQIVSERASMPFYSDLDDALSGLQDALSRTAR